MGVELRFQWERTWSNVKVQHLVCSGVSTEFVHIENAMYRTLAFLLARPELVTTQVVVARNGNCSGQSGKDLSQKSCGH